MVAAGNDRKSHDLMDGALTGSQPDHCGLIFSGTDKGE